MPKGLCASHAAKKLLFNMLIQKYITSTVTKIIIIIIIIINGQKFIAWREPPQLRTVLNRLMENL